MKNTFTILLSGLLFCACSQKQATPSNSTLASESISIKPGVAFGPVYSEMTILQVVTALGQPDSMTDISRPSLRQRELEYTNLGINIISGLSTNVELVHFVGVRAPFAGITKEGIGIGSSRLNIIKAYGQPTEAKKPGLPNFEVLSYRSLNIRFALQDNKVLEITTEFNLR